MDYIDVLLIGTGFLIVWLSVKYSTFSGLWKHLRFCQKQFVWSIGVLIILAVFPPWAWYVGNGQPPARADTEIAEAISNAAKLHADELSKVQSELAKMANDYLAKQPLSKKDEWRKYLNKAYPLGWRMYAIDGKETYAPPSLSYERDFAVVWDANGVSNLTSEWITLRPPDIFPKNRRFIVANNTVTARRQVGKEIKLLLMGETSVTAEILEDQDAFLVLAIGFRYATKDELSPRKQKPQESPAKTAP